MKQFDFKIQKRKMYDTIANRQRHDHLTKLTGWIRMTLNRETIKRPMIKELQRSTAQVGEIC